MKRPSPFCPDLAAAVAFAAASAEVSPRPAEIRLRRLAVPVCRVSVATFSETVDTSPMVITYTLPAGWAPPRELHALAQATQDLVDRSHPDDPRVGDVVGAVVDLMNRVTREQAFVQAPIFRRDVVDLMTKTGYARLAEMTAAKDAADAAALRAAERRAAFSARLARVVATRSANVVPADPRSASPRLVAQTCNGLPGVEYERARKKRIRRAYVRRAVYKKQVAAALASSTPTRRKHD